MFLQSCKLELGRVDQGFGKYSSTKCIPAFLDIMRSWRKLQICKTLQKQVQGQNLNARRSIIAAKEGKVMGNLYAKRFCQLRDTDINFSIENHFLLYLV